MYVYIDRMHLKYKNIYTCTASTEQAGVEVSKLTGLYPLEQVVTSLLLMTWGWRPLGPSYNQKGAVKEHLCNTAFSTCIWPFAKGTVETYEIYLEIEHFKYI